MPPPDCWTIPRTVARPRPVPLPCSFVVKKGSNAWSRVSGGMPWPVSDTSSRTCGSGRPGLVRGELDVRGAEREAAAARHGVAGVHRQVEDDLLDLCEIGARRE